MQNSTKNGNNETNKTFFVKANYTCFILYLHKFNNRKSSDLTKSHV